MKPTQIWMSKNFGLIEQAYDTDKSLPNNGKDLTQWQRFAHKLRKLNDEADADESYRLFYLGRHGQGYHNIGESFYGTEAWDCYYSHLESDPKSPEVVFYDAHLTKLGIQQAQTISKFWNTLITTQKIPLPQKYYVSPLTRAIQTANYTFKEIITPLSLAQTEAHARSPAAAANAAQLPTHQTIAAYKPIVKEFLREAYGVHTCDQRPTKTYLTSTFPNLTFQPQDTFTEQDKLHSPSVREPDSVRARRMIALLQDIITSNDNDDELGDELVSIISMTFHSGAIASLLGAVGHRPFALPTGGAIPVLLKVSRVDGPVDPPFDIHDKTGWAHPPECRSDPLKAGKEGYKDIGEYVREIERGV